MHPPSYPADPLPQVETARDFVLSVAKRCGLRKWSLEAAAIAHDADDTARLSVNMDEISDETFNCMAQQVKPPLVSLERKSN